MKHQIYADNAATTKMDQGAIDALISTLSTEYANASQKYSFSKNLRNTLEKSRKDIAQSINAEPEEIFFTSGGTESDNWAIRGTYSLDKERDTIITTQFEHHAVLKSVQLLQNQGNNVLLLKPLKTGHISTEDLVNVINNKTRLVSIMMVNNELGTIQPIQDLCEIAHKNGAIFHTDAVQAVGHINIDVKELGVDLLSASAHKFNGPKGIGFLYIRKGTTINPLIVGGRQEFNNRAGTENVASIDSMAYALKNNVTHLQETTNLLECIEKTFYDELNKLGVNYHINSAQPKVPGLINVSFKGITGESLQIQLDIKGIYISTGSACDSNNTQISHVLKSIQLEEKYAENAIRISFGKNNSIADAITVAEEINNIISRNNEK